MLATVSIDPMTMGLDEHQFLLEWILAVRSFSFDFFCRIGQSSSDLFRIWEIHRARSTIPEDV